MPEKIQEDTIMIDWKINPQIGVGSLKFGMSPEEVAVVIGPAERTLKIADNFVGLPELQKKFRNDIAEYRIFGNIATMNPTVSFRSGKLINVGFEKIHNTLSLNGMNLFNTSRRKVIEKLTDSCKKVLMTDNEYTLYFMDLGINLANVNFSKKEPQIAVWSGGLYEDLYNNPDYIAVKV
jgi:hypothetical protein